MVLNMHAHTVQLADLSAKIQLQHHLLKQCKKTICVRAGADVKWKFINLIYIFKTEGCENIKPNLY